MECLRRQYDCPHCEEAGEYEERTTSHLDECPMIEVPCPKRECKESVLRRNITEHLSECMFEDVCCKYANIGCKEKVIRRDLHQLEKHEGESQQHLQFAIDAVQQQQRAISDMTAQIQSLQKKQPQLSELNLEIPLKLKWRRGKDLPFEMWIYPKVVVFNEKVYIGGGSASSVDREEQTVIVYDPKQDSYDTLPPYTCKYFSMAVVNNQLVLVGGRDVQTDKGTNQLGVWDEQSKRWTHPLPPMTTACSSPSVATHNNRWLVVIGGEGDETVLVLSRVEILDTDSTQWYHAASLPQPLSHSPPAIIGNMCYLLGGYYVSRKVFSVCLDDLISQAISQPASAPPAPSPWQWWSLPDTLPKYSTALAFNGALLAVGGSLMGSRTIYHYQPRSRSWVKAGELPTKRSKCTCTVLPSGDLFVAGGSGVGYDGAVIQVDIASVQ